MAVNLQITLGTVNYTDFLHVRAAKVASPNTIVWEDWIDVPVANYSFVIPGLDPDDYYISFYDSPDNVSLGSFVSQCFVNAKTNEYQYEVRFYEIGNLPDGVTLNPDQTILNDPYLIGKTIQITYKEGFRPLRPIIEYNFDNTNGDVSLPVGNLEPEEVFCIVVQYATGTDSSSAGGLYVGTLTVTESTKTLLVADKNKRIRCKGMAATQVITVAALSALNIDDGYYFDNSCGGIAVQVKILLPGTDRIFFNGFMAASNEFSEFWVSKGEHLLIRKFDDDYWEVITDYKGVHVGERLSAGYKNMPGTLPEDAALLDGDEYGRLWWWINEILPNTHVITDDTVINVDYVHPFGKEGLYVKHSTLKKFRMPNTQNLSERGLKNFNNYGADAEREYDYPGGFQDEMLLSHGHSIKSTNSERSSSNTADVVRGSIIGDVNNRGQASTGADNKTIGLTGGDEQRVKNIGIIYVRRI